MSNTTDPKTGRVGSFNKESLRLRQSRTRLFGGSNAIARRARLPLSLITLATALVPAAFAQVAAAAAPVSPGVHIDPGSPVAKEYAIPLQQARGSGSGGSGGGQLFGSGITPARSSAGAAAPPPVPATAEPAVVAPSERPDRHVHHATGHRRLARPQPERARAHPNRAPAAPAAELAGPTRAAGGGAGLAWMFGVAALVLALGGLGGAALARHSRSASTRTS